MATVTKGRTFVSGEVVTPTKLNTLADSATVTNIVNADINSAAAIADTKLATISTAGKVSNSATTATSANTASAIVARDASGNFTAGTVTANLTGAVTGNASTATTLQNTRTIAISGDVTGTATSFNGGANIAISSAITADSIVNADINSAAAIADTKLDTISTAGKVANSATTATNANTASAIVARDASGNFTAGTITAALTGNAATATALQNARTIAISGDVTGTATSFNGSANISIPVTINAGSVIPSDLSTGGPSWNASGDLTKQGDLYQNGTAADYNVVSLTNTSGVQVQLNANGNSEGNIRTVTNHPLSFSTNNTQRAVITADGNVGIGTSSPSGNLHIKTSSTLAVETIEADANSSTAAIYLNSKNGSGVAKSSTIYASSAGVALQSLDSLPIYLLTGASGGMIFSSTSTDGKGNPITNCPTTAKAWVNFNGLNAGTFAGGASTISRTAGSTTATITTTNDHGLTGGVLYVSATGLTAGYLGISSIVSSKVFTILTGATTAISGAAVTIAVSPIRSQYNVSSVSKSAAGDYWINFKTPCADANYAVSVTGSATSEAASGYIGFEGDNTSPLSGSRSQAGFRFGFTNTATGTTPFSGNVIVFGN